MKIAGKNTAAQSLQQAEAMKGSKVGAENALDKSKKAGQAAGLDSSAKVDLSERAQNIKKAKELATPNNGIDEAKVARLQALIDKGEYKVDAQAIADRMVDEHLLMPS